jgi:hypothetical protein
MGWKFGHLPNGRPFKKWVDEGEPPHSLADVIFTKREEPKMPQITPDLIIKRQMEAGMSLAEAATIAHRLECEFKKTLKTVDPDTEERERKLAWLDVEQKRLRKLGGLSANAAVDQAMRNWLLQNNSPGQ